MNHDLCLVITWVRKEPDVYRSEAFVNGELTRSLLFFNIEEAFTDAKSFNVDGRKTKLTLDLSSISKRGNDQ